MKKINKKIISILLLFVILFSCTSCNLFKKKVEPTEDNSTDKMTIEKLREKYGEEELYLEPMYNLEKDHIFTLNYATEIDGYKIPSKMVQVYTSPDFSDESKINIKEERVGKQLKVYPPESGAPFVREEELFDSLNVWGEATKYYMRIYFNPYTKEAERLEEPLTMVFSIKSELNVPNLKFKVSDEGKATLYWEAIEGASEYKIYSALKNYPTKGLSEIATISETQFNNFTRGDTNSAASLINTSFDKDMVYYVTAVNGNKESNVSNPIYAENYIDTIPYRLSDHLTIYVDTIEDLPLTANITMLNEKSNNFISIENELEKNVELMISFDCVNRITVINAITIEPN